MRGVARFFEHIFSVLRVFFLWIFALFLPNMFVWYSHQTASVQQPTTVSSFKLGLESIPDSLLISQGYRSPADVGIGLITNQTGKDQAGNNNLDVLLCRGLNVKKVFMPSSSVSHFRAIKKVPVALLKEESNKLIISKQDLLDIDVLIFDMQDVGLRYYGHSTTLLQVMQSAAQYNKLVVVLDRPNLLGSGIESSLLTSSSQDSLRMLPVRHGMTIGELARYFNEHVLDKKTKLHVVAMQKYSRIVEKEDILSMPSTHLDATDAHYGYSFLGLLDEVVPFDVGVGTKKAYQCILLPESISFPKKKWYELHTALKEYGIKSKFYRYFNEEKKQYCRGLHLVVRDINTFSSLQALLTALKFFEEAGVRLAYSHKFDQAIGIKHVRALIDGSLSHKEFTAQVTNNMQAFFYKAFDCFLYKPLPTILHV